MLPFPKQAPDTVEAQIAEFVARGYREVDARRIVETQRLTDATHALGLDACTCGRIAICWIRSAKLRFSANCCPLHRDNVLRSFSDANLRQHEWAAEALNVSYWSSFKEARLAREGEQTHADPFRQEPSRGKLDRCGNCGAPRFACECGEFVEPGQDVRQAVSA